MENSDTSIVGDAKPVNTTKSKPEIKERLLKKQEEAQKELRPANSDSDATGTTLEEQTGKNMGRRRKALCQDDEKADRIPERRSSCDEREGKAHGRRRGSRRNSESGKEASDKRKGSPHEDESREKIAKRILRRRKG